jgi:hypothetical protein
LIEHDLFTGWFYAGHRARAKVVTLSIYPLGGSPTPFFADFAIYFILTPEPFRIFRKLATFRKDVEALPIPIDYRVDDPLRWAVLQRGVILQMAHEADNPSGRNCGVVMGREALPRNSIAVTKTAAYIGDKLREARQGRDLAVASVSARAGVPANLISRYEQGLACPTPEILLALCMAVDLTLEDLFSGLL